MPRFVLAVAAVTCSALSAAGQPTILISNETGNSISTLNLATLQVGTFHTGLANPDGVKFGPDGAVYATSFLGGTFNRIDGPNSYTTLASGMNGSAGFVRDPAGNVFIVNYGAPGGGGTNVSRLAANGTLTLNFATGLSTPDDIIFDHTGTSLYVSEFGSNQIRRVNPTTGAVTPFVSGVGLVQPAAMALDSAGNLYVTNWGNGTISRITPGGVVTNNYASGVPNSFGLLLDESGGYFYATSWTGGTVSRIPFAGGPAEVIAAGFEGPTFMAVVPVPEPAGVLAAVAVLAAGARWKRRRGVLSSRPLTSHVGGRDDKTPAAR